MSAAAFSVPSTPFLRAGLAQAVARVRVRRAVYSGATGLLIGAGVTTVALALLRLRVWERLDTIPSFAYLAPPLLGLCLGIAWGMARHVDTLSVVRYVEQTLDLKDRLSTAHALTHSNDTANPFAARQIADAEAVSAPALMAQAIPLLPLPRRVWAALGLSAFAFGLWFVPTIPYFQSPTQKAEQVQIKKEGERLVRIARALEKKADAKKLSGTKKAAARIAALGEEMKQGNMTRQQSLMKAAKLTEAVKQEQKEAALRAAQNNGGKSLPLAARELSQALDATDPKSQAMREAADALARDDSPEAAAQLEKLAGEMQNAPQNRADLEKRAKQAEALAKALEGTKLEKASPKLKEAAEAMRRGDTKAAAEKLREASQQAANAGESGDEMRALEQAANALSESGEGSEGEQAAGEGDKSGGKGESASEGAGEKDAFNKDGTMKSGGDKGGGSAGKSGEGNGKSGTGSGKGSGNGIGSEAGTPGGKKGSVNPAGPYDDANNAPKGNKSLNHKTAKTPISNDQYSRLYAPKGKMPATRVTGKRGAKGQESVGFYRGAPDKGRSSVPYYDVYGDYAPATENALNRDDIPAPYKKQVRDYFDSIRPGTTKNGGKGK